MKLFVLACLVSVSLAALAVYPVKRGGQLVLDLGPSIRTWTRTRKDGPNEYIKYCGPTERNVRCAQFVSEEGKVIKPESEAQVFENGTLVINNVKPSDAGDYFSNDEPERIHKTENGFWKTPRTRISVVVN